MEWWVKVCWGGKVGWIGDWIVRVGVGLDGVEGCGLMEFKGGS